MAVYITKSTHYTKSFPLGISSVNVTKLEIADLDTFAKESWAQRKAGPKTFNTNLKCCKQYD